MFFVPPVTLKMLLLMGLREGCWRATILEGRHDGYHVCYDVSALLYLHCCLVPVLCSLMIDLLLTITTIVNVTVVVIVYCYRRWNRHSRGIQRAGTIHLGPVIPTWYTFSIVFLTSSIALEFMLFSQYQWHFQHDSSTSQRVHLRKGAAIFPWRCLGFSWSKSLRESYVVIKGSTRMVACFFLCRLVRLIVQSLILACPWA